MKTLSDTIQALIVNEKRITMSEYDVKTDQRLYENQREASQVNRKIFKFGAFFAYVTQHILEDDGSSDVALDGPNKRLNLNMSLIFVQRRTIDKNLIINLKFMNLWLKGRRSKIEVILKT